MMETSLCKLTKYERNGHRYLVGLALSPDGRAHLVECQSLFITMRLPPVGHEIGPAELRRRAVREIGEEHATSLCAWLWANGWHRPSGPAAPPAHHPRPLAA